MIRLAQSPKARADSVVPMINVAFLLLIFFLMTAVIAPPDPIEVTLPEAGAEQGEDVADVLMVSADGELAYGVLRGEAVFAAIPKEVLSLRADASLRGSDLTRLISRLKAAGVKRIELVTVSR